MISIIVVYNNERTLDEVLLKSLKNQTAKFELITLDNTEGKFRSAAEALNYGGKRATGRYIMFIHQDVELDSASWLERVEKILDGLPSLGIAGVAGMGEMGGSHEERKRGCISDCGEVWGNPIQRPEEVQTLDECLLIVPNSIFSKMQFDEKTFDHWHCYAVDYCLSVKQMGLITYVIPAFVYHRSLRRNVENLLRYQKRLYKKHRKNYKEIYTTCGDISQLKFLKLRLRSPIELVSPLYMRLFPDWLKILRKELVNCDRVLDLGCGYNSTLQYCNVPFSVGVESFNPYLQESKKKGIHNQYIKADIRKIEFQPEAFDAVVAIEVLEHLTKQEGAQLLNKMERWATKKIIITTPNGYLWQDGYDDNPLQEHKSGWSIEELRNFEFKVFGINGWKSLRGYMGLIKYRPGFLWRRISDLTQKMTYYYPKLAFQLLAIKQIDEGDGK